MVSRRTNFGARSEPAPVGDKLQSAGRWHKVTFRFILSLKTSPLIPAMRQLQTILLKLLLMKLLTVSSENVTVHPSLNSNPFYFSVWITWPQSTNKVALTIQCSSYQPKVDFRVSDGSEIGMLELISANKILQIHCKQGGTRYWYGGNLLQFSTRNWGICNSGTSETLIIERTSARLRIMMGDVLVFNRNWAATDGKCLSEAGFWRIINYGRTVVSAESILGKAYLTL